MADVNELFEDLFGRVDENVGEVVAGLSAEQLATAPGPGANTIGWLVWHLTRVQDHHISELHLLGKCRIEVFQRVCGNVRLRLERIGVFAGKNHVGVDVVPVNPDFHERNSCGSVIMPVSALAATTYGFDR